MPSDLVQKSCTPCHGGTAPLQGGDLAPLLKQVPGWRVVDRHHLHRDYVFPDFASALDFVNQIGAIAEKEQHHPDITLGWGKVKVDTFTHAIGGLSENDFILAAKIEAAAPADARQPGTSG